uniref:L-aminoadipate-semialdehyde dehydrogenase-phosphopantetheinyl transferase n=1 Tax=Panagrellus redivivus TaxID=6233 RepID=A0A7E4URL6_PANRE
MEGIHEGGDAVVSTDEVTLTLSCFQPSVRTCMITVSGTVERRVIALRHRLFASQCQRPSAVQEVPLSTLNSPWNTSKSSPDLTTTMATKDPTNTKCSCNRLAFSLSGAFEHDHFEAFYRKAIQSVTAEDYEKIVAYRYKDDSLACLAGRLFLRQITKRLTGTPWHEVEFARTEKGKPYVTNPAGTTFGLNVTHQGDYAALATSCSEKVGVDVMRLDISRNNKTADEYINSMARSASAAELRQMRGQPTEAMKMTMFYRFWCLKEAVLKATGDGLLDDLSRYDFRVDTSDRYAPGCYVTSTTVLADGKLQNQWVFDESFVDRTHSIAVCRERKLPRTCMFAKDPEAKLFFSKVNFDFLLDGATVLNPLPNDAADDFDNFQKKLRKNF